MTLALERLKILTALIFLSFLINKELQHKYIYIVLFLLSSSYFLIFVLTL